MVASDTYVRTQHRSLRPAHLRLAAAATFVVLAGACCDSPGKGPSGDPAGIAAVPSRMAARITPAACRAPYPAGTATAEGVFCADPSSMDRAEVLRIVDGDTIHVRLGGKDETIRFYGTNTTERGQACFGEASDRVRELVGAEVRLRADARDRDRFGRLLRYVYSPAGLSVDAEMIAEGLAHAWTADGALRVPLIALEDRARQGGTGCLWR